MRLQTIPRTVVRSSLRATRLPLNAAEAVFRRGDRETARAPASAVEAFEATVKRLAGSILRDDQLVQEGRMQEVRAAEQRKALEPVARRQRNSKKTAAARERVAPVKRAAKKSKAPAKKRKAVVAKRGVAKTNKRVGAAKPVRRKAASKASR
jgi:hypothetical protein